MAEFITEERMIEYSAPQPEEADRKSLPAYVLRIRLRRAENGGTALSFLTARNQGIPLKRFSVAYSCEARRNGKPDLLEGRVSCEGSGINDGQVIVCHAALGEDGEDVDCIPETLSAWVCETEEENGRITSWTRDDFYVESDPSGAGVMYVCGEDPLAAVPAPAREETDGTKEKAKNERTAKSEKSARRSGNPLVFTLVTLSVVVAVAIGVALIVAAVFFGYHAVMFRYLKGEADALIEADRQDLAEDFVGGYLDDNIFFRQYADDLKAAVGDLRAKRDWGGAYALAKKGPYASLTEAVCREAAEDALGREDWQEAYLYAAASPSTEPLCEEIAAEAARHVWDAEARRWNEEAYLTAQKSSDPAVGDQLVGLLAERYYADGDPAMTRAAADQMNDRQAAGVWYDRLKEDELNAVLAEKSDVEVLRYLEENEADLKDPSLIGEYRDRLFKAAWSERRLADVFRMAADWGYETSSLSVRAEDADIRADLSDYFRLTPAQMRAYHAEPLSARSGVVYIKSDGTVSWEEHGERRTAGDAVSVSAGPFVVSILHGDGTVTAYATAAAGDPTTGIPDRDAAFIRQAEALAGVTAVASGERHTAFLLEDGTVTVIGDNSFGQANTYGWRDIVAVAAGQNFTVGLRSDGTAVACGSDAAGQLRPLADYRNIVDVRACHETVILLFRDGTAEAVGERGMGLGDVSGFRGVRKIRADCGTVIAEKTDGGYLLAGGGAEGLQGSVSEWKNETEFDVGDGFIARMDADGSVRTEGAGAPKVP